jgi:hypothetical protein
LENDIACSIALIGCGEDVAVVEEDHSYAPFVAFVDVELHGLVLDLDFYAGFESDACRVICQVTCLALSVPLIVRGNDSDLLS